MLQVYRSFPTYVMDFRFDRLPKEIEDEYDALALEAEASFMTAEIEPKEKIYRKALVNSISIMYEEFGFTQAQIVDKLGISSGFIDRALKELKKRPIDIRAMAIE
jgi:hypothetical protein